MTVAVLLGTVIAQPCHISTQWMQSGATYARCLLDKGVAQCKVEQTDFRRQSQIIAYYTETKKMWDYATGVVGQLRRHSRGRHFRFDDRSTELLERILIAYHQARPRHMPKTLADAKIQYERTLKMIHDLENSPTVHRHFAELP